VIGNCFLGPRDDQAVGRPAARRDPARGVRPLISTFKKGWQIVGLDIDTKAQAAAIENASKYGLDGRVEFRCCVPDETRDHKGQYDAVFKTA